MTVSVLFGKVGAKIGSLQLDASLKDSHSFENEVSSFPIEDGFTISDNIRVLPVQLTIDGIVTDSPISVRFQDVNDIVSGNSSNRTESLVVEREDTAVRVETARDVLLKIRGENGKDPEIVTIVTGLKVYENMVMTKLTFDRDGKTGRALPFTASFTRLVTKQLSTETLKPKPVVKDKASSKKNKGKQKPAEASAKTKEDTSFARSLFNKFGFRGS